MAALPGKGGPSWRVVARRELLDIVVSPKFAWTFAVSATLVLLAFWVGARGFLLEQRRHEAARAADLRQMRGVTDWLEVSPLVSLPPQPLETLVAGVANDIGRNATVGGRGAIATTGSRYASEPVAALLRVLDLEFVFRVVLGLFAVLLGYDAVCGERARGTLRLCFAGGLERSSFLGGKIAGTLAGLTLPLLVPIGLGALVFRIAGVPMAALDWARLALVLLAGLLYLATLLALSTWISAVVRQPAHAFFLALSAWVLLVLVTPRAAVSLAAHQAPVLSRDAIEAERARLQTELWTRDRTAFRDRIEGILGGAGATGGRDPQQRMAEVNRFIEEQATERDRRLGELERSLLERREAQQATQRRLAFGLARVSPAACFTLAAAELAGTSLALEDELRAQLARYQEEIGRFQMAKSGGRRSGGGMRLRIAVDDGEPEAPKPIDPAELPTFHWQAPDLRPALSRAAGDLALLLAFPLAFYAAAFVTFQRYDLR